MDILAVLRSFLPPGGSIRAVTVYPSDYGIQRMKDEAAAGPQVRYTLAETSGALCPG